MKIQPLNNNVLIEITKQEKTKSGIYLDVRSDLILEEAKVIAVPKGSQVKKGDTIFFKAFAMDTVETDGKVFHFLREDQILGVKK